MPNRIFVVDQNTAVGQAIVRGFLDRDHAVASIITTGSDSPQPEETQSDSQQHRYSRILWNRSSQVSVHSAVLAAVNSIGEPDKTVLVYSPGNAAEQFHELSASGVSKVCDGEIRGPVLMFRELLRTLLRSGGGKLGIVLHRQQEQISTMEAAALGALREAATSLFPQYQGTSLFIYGFDSVGTDPAELASSVVETLAEGKRRSAFRWQRSGNQAGFQSALTGISRVFQKEKENEE
ncbi:MAG: hypothetical protein K9L68_08480 [Spirochaetales bacterium]|nr:hypothetical protein [Spirochaetales bacterium]MCF7938620.1 hypothetical protein [Spirochaetales bacterium]